MVAATPTSHSTITNWLSFGRVMLISGGLAVIWVFAFTSFATAGSYLYNLQSDFVGGVEATLAEVHPTTTQGLR